MSGRGETALLSGAYVLNAVSDQERAAFAELLRGSEQLRSEVTELADTAVALGLAVPAAAPPARLRAELLAAVASTPQLPPHESLVLSDETPPATGRREASAALRWARRPASLLAVAAAAVLLLLVGGLLGRSLLELRPSEQQAAAFAELNAAPDVESVPTTLPGGGAARLIVSESLGRSALVWTGDLPRVEAGRAYELWYMGKTTHPAGLLDADTADRRFRVLDGTLHDGDLVGMTIEAAGGAPQPTGDAVLVIDPAVAG
ncbi:anti-sigma factor [Naasia aerilata]|uniref:Regulator of SigK n=1 Tax=Naasia aerilata TaxID=1162966 RepID=A0ABM8G9P3_9MICO|nr:anti-sigma factor [Naasia aerilata]BDZ44902.1 hypothetical protein GCM10025866_08110 [Naasia aerilata]